jgi:hypothetical protein
LRELSSVRELAPLAGLAFLAAVGLYLWLRRKPENSSELERERRAYVNRVGRIVEGHIMEVVEPPHAPAAEAKPKPKASSGGFLRARAQSDSGTNGNGARKLLYYSYSISGVTYETAQDITGMEERLHLTRVAAGQITSVKYDPSNPSNSILLADDWSGLH